MVIPLKSAALEDQVMLSLVEKSVTKMREILRAQVPDVKIKDEASLSTVVVYWLNPR